MIESLYNDTCTLWRRDATADTGGYGGKAADTYSVVVTDEPCVWLPKIGNRIIQDDTGRDIVVDGTFRMNEEIRVTDKIQYDGYDYVVVLVQPKREIITGIVEYYMAIVQRQRQELEDNDPAKAVRIVR